MKRVWAVLFSILPVASCALGQDRLPRVFLIDPATIVAVRDLYAKKSDRFNAAIARVVEDAEKALKTAPVSVVEKPQAPPSGDKHDYMSMAPYWWPDSTKPGGLPYVRRDGEVNPDRYRIGDRERIGTLISVVSRLSLAFFITGEEKYATHAIEFLRTWFLRPATRMNPNLQYSQIVLGRDQGRGIGIIDTYGLRFVVDGIGLLESSRFWTTEDLKGLKEWFRQYLTWLQTSDHGKQESREKNNHGTTYAVQAVTMARFIGRDDLARDLVRAAKEGIIAKQIEPDGSQPLELARTKSWNYSLMNLEALFQLAWLGDQIGEDLWSYTSPDGRSIRKAIDYLLPSALGREEWTRDQITRMEVERMYQVLRIAAVKYGSSEYDALSKSIPGVNIAEDRATLLYPAFHGSPDNR